MAASSTAKGLTVDSGKSAGSVVFNADSPVISRDFRQLQEIHPFFACRFGSVKEQYAKANPAGWGCALDAPKLLGYWDGRCRENILGLKQTG
jgi:hypothetical protein